MHSFLAIGREILEVGIAISVLVGWLYLQYRFARWRSDKKDQKADIQTLFNGEK